MGDRVLGEEISIARGRIMGLVAEPVSSRPVSSGPSRGIVRGQLDQANATVSVPGHRQRQRASDLPCLPGQS